MGFAKLLWSELQTAMHDLIREPEDIIAQRTYDLVFHALDYIAEHGSIELDWTSESVAKVPDLTQWPPTTESS